MSNSVLKQLIFVLLFTVAPRTSALAKPSELTVSSQVESIIESSCTECHNSIDLYGGLDLKNLSTDLVDVETIRIWTQVLDRVRSGEMPPAGSELSEDRKLSLLSSLQSTLQIADLQLIKSEGRSGSRRMTRQEYEQYLRDVLHLPRLDIRDALPIVQRTSRYEQVNSQTPVSVQELQGYITVTEQALLQSVNIGEPPKEPATIHMRATQMFAAASTYGGPEAMFYAKDNQRLPLGYSELNELRADASHDPDVEMAIFRSPSWPYYAYPYNFSSPNGGTYRIRFSARTVLQQAGFKLAPASHSIPMTFRARKVSGPDVSGDVRATGGLIDIRPEPHVYETIVYLKPTETFEYGIFGLPVPRPINPPDAPLYYKFPPMPEAGHPGVAFQWIEITGPLAPETWPTASHQSLFADIPAIASPDLPYQFRLETDDPHGVIETLIPRFLSEVSVTKPSTDEVQISVQRCRDKFLDGMTLEEALVVTYASILVENRFLSSPIPNTPRIEQHDSIQTRLGFFLTGRHLSESLARELQWTRATPANLRIAVARLVATPDFESFTKTLADNWLDLKSIRRDSPDIRIYPEYRFDDYLIDSLYRETQYYVLHMFRENLPASYLVDSDFLFVNDKLANHYGLAPVDGSDLRKVRVPNNSPYGGLITQGAIAKVTSNGVTTSPIIRGAWIADRLLGTPPPPPPPSIPAVEPDLRGSTTIRELLAAHSEDSSCNSCHAKFDPFGIALEHFDVMGGWRDNYRSMQTGTSVTGIDRAGHQFEYFTAAPVDASGHFEDGDSFTGIKDLKTHLLKKQRQIARNLISQFALYATGVQRRYSDRAQIEKILDACESDGFRTMDLLTEFVRSPIFTGKWK